MGESPEHARIMGSVEPNSKGVHCEVESEGSCRQISGPTDKNHICSKKTPYHPRSRHADDTEFVLRLNEL